MPTVLESVPVPADFLPPRKKWTRAELDKLESLGLVDTTGFELVEGDLLSQMGKNRAHVYFVAMLAHWLGTIFDFKRVNPECPIDVSPEDLPTNQPQPDLVVQRSTYRELLTKVPNARDVALVVEVSDSSLAFDLTTKAGLYARAGIVEYWVVDIQGRRLLSHRQPVNGAYEAVKAYGADEQILPLESPGGALDLKKIFDPEA